MENLLMLEFETEEEKELYIKNLERKKYNVREIKSGRELYSKSRLISGSLLFANNSSHLESFTSELSTYLIIGKREFNDIILKCTLFSDDLNTSLDVSLNVNRKIGVNMQLENFTQAKNELIDILNKSNSIRELSEYVHIPYRGMIQNWSLNRINYVFESHKLDCSYATNKGHKLIDKVKPLLELAFQNDRKITFTPGFTNCRDNIPTPAHPDRDSWNLIYPEFILIMTKDKYMEKTQRIFFDTMIIRFEKGFNEITFLHNKNSNFEEEKKKIKQILSDKLKKTLLVERFK